MKSADQIEIDAILGLCHHQDGPFRDWCEACVFRQQAAIEHLQSVIAATVACLGGIHASCSCEEPK